MLEDLLLHVVPVLAALDRVGGNPAHHDGTGNRPPREAGHRHLAEADIRHVAVLEVNDAPGYRYERRDIGSDEVLSLAEPDRERAPEPGSDDTVGMFRVDDADRVRASEHAGRGAHRFREVPPFVHATIDELGNDFGIGVGGELVAVVQELPAQRLVILDDSVVHYRDRLPGDVGMGNCARWALRGLPIGCAQCRSCP